jgi:hypothetical protein
MSTGLNCVILEEKPGRWHYILEDYNAPKNSWDWMEYAKAYGPFQTHDKAYDHLSDHHANPGSHFIIPHEEFRLTPVLEGLLKESETNKKKIERNRFF